MRMAGFRVVVGSFLSLSVNAVVSLVLWGFVFALSEGTITAAVIYDPLSLCSRIRFISPNNPDHSAVIIVPEIILLP